MINTRMRHPISKELRTAILKVSKMINVLRTGGYGGNYMSFGFRETGRSHEMRRGSLDIKCISKNCSHGGGRRRREKILQR